ncbi:hypothetical protein BaRGS_00034889 [Batillaria attramentaria]|uniref:Uncharacterized protein n=1 Tax=Batillaria attramentaria TaxID=370345 RepID=A0ABD0JG86_9CAEN
MEDEIIEKKDYSRPFFSRNKGEVGLYFDVDDAVTEDAHAYGSEHLMRVEMNDKLEEHLAAADLVKVKGELDRRGHFRGVILEEVRRGGVLAVTFDSVTSLDDVWTMSQNRQLSALFQAIFVDKSLLKALGVRKLTVRVRMWPDEVEACREEMEKMNGKKVNIDTRPRDVELIKRVREFQKSQSGQLQELRDRETEFDRHLSEFLLVVKRSLPQCIEKLPNLKDFQTNMTVAMGTNPSGMDHVKNYLSTLEFLRTLLAQAETSICLPLSLIPARCETEKQRELKQKMKSACLEMQRLLKPTTSLKEAVHKDWERKVLPRERTLFMGLISLVPLGVEKVSDIDVFLDEYVTSFPIQF